MAVKRKEGTGPGAGIGNFVLPSTNPGSKPRQPEELAPTHFRLNSNPVESTMYDEGVLFVKRPTPQLE